MKTNTSITQANRPNSGAHRLSTVSLVRLFSLLLILIPGAAHAEDYIWLDNGDGTCTITDYVGPGGDVTIPDRLGGLTVTVIGAGAFFTTPMPSVTIPGSVTTIEYRAFYSCPSLREITVDAANPVYSSIDGVLFNKPQTELIQYPPGRSEASYTIPGSVTSIGAEAFYSCDGLTSVTIPDSVTSIGDSAFFGCSSLSGVTIPDSVITIGGGAFSACYGLLEITVDAANPFYSSIDGVLFNKPQTELVQYPPGKAEASYTIPGSVTSIVDRAFAYCNGLLDITVDAANPAFMSVAGVLFNKPQTELIQYPTGKAEASYTIPGSVTSIGGGAFAGCIGLTSVTIPDSVTTIGDSAFEDCSGLTGALTIPDSVTNIGFLAFSYCTSLNGITIGNSVASIGIAAFSNCHSLTSVLFGNSVITIGDYAFRECTRLTGIIIPDSVTSLGRYAFADCTSLTSVIIGSSVTSIGDYAFYFCTGLTGVYFRGDAPGLGTDVFINVNNGTVYYIPGTVGWGTTFGGLPTAVWPPSPVDVDWIVITSYKSYIDGTPSGAQPWEFEIWVQNVDSGSLHHIDVTPPSPATPFTMFEDNGSWGWDAPSQYSSLANLRVDYPEGIYTFVFRNISNGQLDTVSLNYSGLPGEPSNPVNFTYPSVNGQAGISINPTFTWTVDAGAGDTLMMGLEDNVTDELYWDAPVSMTTSSWTPGPLQSGRGHLLEVSVLEVKDWVGPDWPTETTVGGDGFRYSPMIEYLNEITFTTSPNCDFCGPPGSPEPDGYVDYWDLLYFAQRWHTDPSDTNWDPRCDLDKEDNYVDYWDLLVFAQQWHKGVKPE